MSGMGLFDIFRIFLRKTKSLVFRMKARLQRTSFILACNGPAQIYFKDFLEKRNWQPVALRNLNDFAIESLNLFPASSSTVAAPCFNGQRVASSSKTFPPLRAHVLQASGGSKLIASAYSPGVISEDDLLLPFHLVNSCNRVTTDGGGVFNLGDKFHVGCIRANVELKEGILIGGAGAFNWYHFVVEVLPKAFLSKNLPSQFDRLPLLVPDECRRFPSFSSALEHFSSGRPLQFIQKGDLVGVERLIVFDEPSIGPFNLIAGEWPRVEDYAQHDAFLRSFFEEFRSKALKIGELKVKAKNPERRIFLVRPGVRRNYNQDELLAIALQYGFEPFSPEAFTLAQQAKIFSESSAVIGPSGAAWVGMIFREAPLHGLTWLPREYKSFCGYSNLATLLGHRLNFIEAKTPRALRSTGEAYVSDYQVCPIKFESALKTLAEKNP